MNKALVFVAGVAAAAVVGYLFSSDEKKEKEVVLRVDENGEVIQNEESQEEEKPETRLSKLKKEFSKERIQEHFVDFMAWSIKHKEHIEATSLLIGLVTSIIGLRNAIKDGVKTNVGKEERWPVYLIRYRQNEEVAA